MRSVIENACPPLQVYATTGRLLQTTLYRHVPLLDACSCCAPDAQAPQMPTQCATGSPTPNSSDNDEDDIALPFLSYAAGLMTAAEISKLALAGHAESPQPSVL